MCDSSTEWTVEILRGSSEPLQEYRIGNVVWPSREVFGLRDMYKEICRKYEEHGQGIGNRPERAIKRLVAEFNRIYDDHAAKSAPIVAYILRRGDEMERLSVEEAHFVVRYYTATDRYNNPFQTRIAVKANALRKAGVGQ